MNVKVVGEPKGNQIKFLLDSPVSQAVVSYSNLQYANKKNSLHSSSLLCQKKNKQECSYICGQKNISNLILRG